MVSDEPIGPQIAIAFKGASSAGEKIDALRLELSPQQAADRAVQQTTGKATTTSPPSTHRRNSVPPTNQSVHPFEQKVQEVASSRGVTHLDAVAIVASNEPELHRQYVSASNTKPAAAKREPKDPRITVFEGELQRYIVAGGGKV
jgi:hypothetical protein